MKDSASADALDCEAKCRVISDCRTSTKLTNSDQEMLDEHQARVSSSGDKSGLVNSTATHEEILW